MMSYNLLGSFSNQAKRKKNNKRGRKKGKIKKKCAKREKYLKKGTEKKRKG